MVRSRLRPIAVVLISAVVVISAVLTISPASGSTNSADIEWVDQYADQYLQNARMRRPPTAEQAVFLPAYVQLSLMRRQQLSPVKLLDAHIARMQAVNPELNAITHETLDLARTQATESEQRYKNGTARPLEGLPFAVKELFDFLANTPNDFGSKPFADINFQPPFTSVYVQRMLDAGVVVVGKTNTPEFGHKGTTDNFVHGPTSTPFDSRFNAGGSSGGSAAAVASFMVSMSEGSDAGGSVRIPAAMTGTVTIKPSVGRWPQDAPPFPYAPFFTPGPMTRTVLDTALLMQAVSGPYEGDPMSMDGTLNYIEATRQGVSDSKPLQGVRIAYSPDLDIFQVEPAVEQAVKNSLKAFRQAGATVEEVTVGFDSIMITDVGGANRRPLTQLEFAEKWVDMQSGLYGHARDLFLEFGIPLDLREHRDELTPEFAAMLDRSATMSAEQYRHLDFLRADVLHQLNGVLSQYDFIVTPTVATVGVPNATDGNTLGPATINGQPVQRTIGWTLTYPFNFSGHPVASVPAGLADNPLGGPDLPIGLQIVGPMKADDKVIKAAAAFERFNPQYQNLPR